MRTFTVRIDGDEYPDRAWLVMGITGAGDLLIESENGGPLRVVSLAACHVAQVYLNQDEREWWRGLAAALASPPAEVGHEH